MLVKICGLTSEKEAELVSEYGADLAGVVLFFEKSKRNVSTQIATRIVGSLNNGVKGVAVMVSPSIDQIKEAESTGVKYLQIHGELTEEMINSAQLPIIKAFNVSDLDKYDYYASFENIVGFVMDASEYGSGKTFDWNLIGDFDRGNKLFILAGGLNPDNVKRAIEFVKPDGVDVSSGVEYTDAPGKDPQLIRAFIQNAK